MNNEFPKNYGENYHGDATKDEIREETKSELTSAEDMLEYAISTKDHKLKEGAKKLLKERILKEDSREKELAVSRKNEDDSKNVVASKTLQADIEKDIQAQLEEKDIFLAAADRIRLAIVSAGITNKSEIDWAERRTMNLMEKGQEERLALDIAIKEWRKDRGQKKYTGSMSFGIEGGVVNPMERADGPVEN